MARKRTRIRYPFIGAIVICVALAAVIFLWATSQPKTQSSNSTAPAQPKPGSPGNPGDANKSRLGNQASTTPTSTPNTPTTTPEPTVAISGLSIQPRNDGTAHVSDQIVGASDGSCSVSLTSPSGQKQVDSISVVWSGTYYSCSGTITGVSEAGSWTANMTYDGDGKTSNTATTSFNVTGG